LQRVEGGGGQSYNQKPARVYELTKHVLDLKDRLEPECNSRVGGPRWCHGVTKLTTSNNTLQRTFIGPRTTTIAPITCVAAQTN